MCKTFVTRLSYPRRFGIVNGIYNLWQVLVARRMGGSDFAFRVARGGIPATLRCNTSDLAVAEKIFLDADYALHMTFDAPVIIDAGANIGLSAIFFALGYPGARIIALEPEQSNFEMLKINCRHYRGIESVRAALWHQDGAVRILSDPTDSKWGFQVEPALADDPQGIPAISLSSLVRERGLETIDILKLDIEGAEKEILGPDARSWLPRVRVVLVELHEEMVPGITEHVCHLMRELGFSHEHRGETEIFFSKSFTEKRGSTI